MKGDFLAGRDFTNITALNEEALLWCADQAGRWRRAVACVPRDEHEGACLAAARGLEVTRKAEAWICPRRRITFDSFVSYEGRRFGVPYWYDRRECRVCREGRVLHAYSDDLSREIVAHAVTWDRGDSWCDGQWSRRPAVWAAEPDRCDGRRAGRPGAREPRIRQVRLQEMGVMGGPGRSPYELASVAAAALGLALGAGEPATLASDHDMGESEMAAVPVTFCYFAEKRRRASIEVLLSLGRLPRHEPKTFEGFDFSRIQGRDAAALERLPSLADLYVSARRNVAFVGPGGIGKTHLAQTYGRECCMGGLKAYYVKAGELGDRFRRAAERGNSSRVVTVLVKPRA